MLLDKTVDDERVSSPDPRLRAGPAPGDRRIRLVVQGPAVFPGRRTPGLQPLPLMTIAIIASHRVIAGPCLHIHRGHRPIASLRLVIIMREDERVLRGLVHHTSPDGKYSCPRPLPSHQRREPYQWFLRRPGQNTWKNLQLKWMTQQQWRVRQRLTTRQVTAQQMTAQHMTGQQATGRQEMTSQSSWMVQKKLPIQQVNSQQRTAQHFMMTTRQVWPAQHAFRPWHWTAQQPIELQQGIRHWQDKTHPFWQVSAVLFSRQCQQLSTRLRWLISCPSGLCCSDRWTRVWLFPMPRPGRLHSQRFLLPEMTTPHPGGPRLHLGLQTDDPRRQWNGPGHLWEEPGGWTTLESPSEGLHRLIHLPEMLLLWIFRLLWTLRTRSRRGPLPMMRMKTAITRRSRQPSINCQECKHPDGFPVQSRLDTDHGVDDGHGTSMAHVCRVGRAAGRLVCDIRQQTTQQVCIAVSGPQGRVDRCHVHAMGQREGPTVRVPAIQDGPSSSADRSVTRCQGDFDRSTATGRSWFPELMDLSQEDPIPLCVEGRDLLTQDVLTGDGVTETRPFGPSNLHAWKLYGPSWGRRA